jgi:hypothetical protein
VELGHVFGLIGGEFFAGGNRGARLGFGNGGVGIVRNFADHALGVDVVVDAAGILDRDVEGAEDQLGVLHVNGVPHKRVDDFHQRRLDGGFIFDLGNGVKTRLRWAANAAVDALVEVAELLSAESGGAAADSGDLNMSAIFEVWHIGPVDDFLVVASQDHGFIGVRGCGEDEVGVKSWKLRSCKQNIAD